MAERVIADHKVTCSNQVTSLQHLNSLFIFIVSIISRRRTKANNLLASTLLLCITTPSH